VTARGAASADVEPFGDGALLVTLGDGIGLALSRRVQRLATTIDDERGAGVPFGSPVVGYGTVLVPYDATILDLDAARRLVARLARRAGTVGAAEEATGALVEIPTRYGGADGPDLEAVAERTGLRPRDIAELHAGTEYRVHFLGFAPGFAYLGVLPEALSVPRRATPRTRVPRGSVAIADRQTAVYPIDSPGGWHLIGRTDRSLWDPTRDPPASLRPGDRVRFVPVDAP